MRTRPSWTTALGRNKSRCYHRSSVPTQVDRHKKLFLITLSLVSILQITNCQQHESIQSLPYHQQQQQQQQQQSQLKYSTREVRTRYGILRGIVARSSIVEGVEAYLGVPYATPPLGALRYMPPVTPTQWRGPKLADTMPPACPQKIPGSGDPGLSRRRRAYIDRIAPLLVNQSEDCLYLNLYVPRPSHSSSTELLPALLLIHGDSYSWGAGNPLDGTALAAHGRLIVVSINFRLGVLGFLKASSNESAQGNYGLMDLVAGLHWLRENVEAFGGDPERLSVLGHGTGAALANFLAVSPMAKELVERVILLGGSALSPWAIQRDPNDIKQRVASEAGCLDDDVAGCLRTRSVEELLAIRLDLPRFTPDFAPFADGAVLPLASTQATQPTVSSAGVLPLVPGPGGEFAALGDRDLLIGLTSNEAWLDLNEDDLKNGLNESRRDRILRTFVRNIYRYHLHEIYSTLRNEYTDWESGEQSPAAIREGLVSLLGDGQVAAPILKLALLHSSSGGRGYFFHFQPGDRPSQRGEELPYLLGIPLLRNEPNRSNYLELYGPEDENLSRMLVRYLSNFVRRGDPNEGNSDGFSKNAPFWDSYDSINQLYLETSKSPEMRSHYRGHKMSLWLNLLPQLHRPGYEVLTQQWIRHHHLADNPNLYEGVVRPRPLPAPPSTAPSPTEASPKSITSTVTTECTTNLSAMPMSTPTYPTTHPTQQPHPKLSPGPNNLLRKFASNHYQSYTTALTVTIAVGIFLLLLNILIFAGIYHQRDRNVAAAAAAANAAAIAAATTSSSNSSSSMKSYLEQKKKEQLLEAGCSGDHSSGGKLSRLSSFIMDSSISSSPPAHKHKLAQELELQLQEFQCSPPPAGKRMSLDPPSYISKSPGKRSRTPSPCVDVASRDNELTPHDPGIPPVDDDDDDDEFLPEPPPPPKAPAPNVCPGILRQPGTPGSAKKRVQIQEISV